MCKFFRKSNERIYEILWLYSIIHVAMEATKTSDFTCQSKSFISIFQLVSYNLSLAMIWQMTYAHKMPELCSATLIHANFDIDIFQDSVSWNTSLGPSTLHGQIQMSATWGKIWAKFPREGTAKVFKCSTFCRPYPPPPQPLSV